MNPSTMKMRKEIQKLRDKNFHLQVFIQKQDRQISHQERKEILKRLMRILKIIDPYQQYHEFFPNKKSPENVSITEILDNFAVILKDKMFDAEWTENELFEYVSEELDE